MISIHALARSATDVKLVRLRYKLISIHALARSATNIVVDFDVWDKDFNPRTREECDRNILYITTGKIFKTHYLLKFFYFITK